MQTQKEFPYLGEISAGIIEGNSAGICITLRMGFLGGTSEATQQEFKEEFHQTFVEGFSKDSSRTVSRSA